MRTNHSVSRFSYIAPLVFLLFLFVVPPLVLASEGRIRMANGSVACEGVSIWDSDRYHIIGRCQGLTYPFAERLDRYMLWANPSAGGNAIRLREVERGLFDAQTDARFTSLFITAEEDSAPRTPGATTVASGNVEPYDFSRGQTVTGSQPTPTPLVTAAPAAAAQPATVKGINFGSNAVVNLTLIGILAAVVIWILFFLRR